MRPSIGRKLYLSLIGAITISWLCVVFAVGWVVKHETDEVFNSGLEEMSQRLLSLAIHDVEDHASEAIKNHLDPLDHEEYITYQLFNRAGKIIARSHKAPEFSYGIPLQVGHYFVNEQHFYVDASKDGNYIIQVAERSAHRNETLFNVLEYLLMPLGALLVAVVAVIYWAVRGAQSSITQFGHEVAKRDSKDLSPVDTETLPSELLSLGQSVNSLILRLQLALHAERSFTSNSAHELRTPIAAALAQLDVLSNQLSDPDSKSRVGTARDMIDRLEKMTVKLLQLAKAESGKGLVAAKLDLNPLVSMLVRDLSFRTTRKLLFSQPGQPVWIQGDMDALGIAIQNLLENANKYAADNSPIEIEISPDGQLTIRNDCEPIPPEVLQTLRNRFVRHNHTTHGSGLGLSIVDTILEQSNTALVLTSPCYDDNRGFMSQVSFSIA